jgi:hypothetical protein
MRALLALISLATLLLAGCTLGCGFDGEGDRTFRRGNESMILCTNGGFALVLEARIVEGRYTFQDGATLGTEGATGALAFTFTDHGDGTASAPELGALAWERVTLDKTDLDHAHLQCDDLEARPWWTAQ